MFPMKQYIRTQPPLTNLSSSAVDCGFESRSGQIKDYKIGICCSPLSTYIKQTGWLEIRNICPSGATCLSADCCFSELAL